MMDNEDLGTVISRIVADRMTPEYVEKQVQTRVDKLIDEAVGTALRTYSDTGKLIEQAVADALKINRLDLPSYGHVVTRILKAQIEAIVGDLVAGRLSADMEELLKLAPKTIKLSEIADVMLKAREHEGYGQVITVIVEHNDYGSAWVYLDEDAVYSEREKYRADIRLLIGKDGVISSAWIKDRETKTCQQIGLAYGLEQRIRAFVACGTVIEIDEDHVVTTVGDY